jgi:hypothetical protein
MPKDGEEEWMDRMLVGMEENMVEVKWRGHVDTTWELRA